MTVPTEPMDPCFATKTIAGKTWTCRIPRHPGPDNHYFTRDEPGMPRTPQCQDVKKGRRCTKYAGHRDEPHDYR